jgi:hypothetical protein
MQTRPTSTQASGGQKQQTETPILQCGISPRPMFVTCFAVLHLLRVEGMDARRQAFTARRSNSDTGNDARSLVALFRAASPTITSTLPTQTGDPDS